MVINRRTVKRPVTLDEFMRLKKDGGTFENMRYDAKSVNFSFLFGAVAATFAKRVLTLSWTEERADEYIQLHKLYNLKDKVIARYSNEGPLMWKYITCASHIRDRFFETYPGLMERIKRERVFAAENGYVRCWHGAVRRTPELFLMSRNDKGNPCGDDQKVYGKKLSTLLNVSANSTIQNYEAVLVMGSIAKIDDLIKARGLKSNWFNSVHDSIDFYIHKDEVQIMHDLIVDVCEKYDPMAQGMPQEVDMDVADYNQGEYYKGGKNWDQYL